MKHFSEISLIATVSFIGELLHRKNNSFLYVGCTDNLFAYLRGFFLGFFCP